MSKETWLTAFQHEIDFWKHYIETHGPEYPGDFENRMSRNTILQDNLHDCLPDKEYAMILDVGAGPMTVLGKRHPVEGRSLMITAVDPLAEHYNKILADNNVIPPVTTEFAEAEDLQKKFKQGTFDLVYCQNALDHSYDPVKGIEQMIEVVVKSGWVVLWHENNEAENERYQDMHQWNFCEKNGQFIIWNKKVAYNVTEIFADMATVKIETIGGHNLVKIKKHE